MMEATLSSKIADFMSALDQVKKYKSLVSSMIDFTLIILGTIVIGLTYNIVMRLHSVMVMPDYGSNILGYFLFFLIFPAGIAVGVYWVSRKMKSVEVGQWKSKLDEGVPGAIELLQSLDWEKVFSDIRYAKVGFLLYGIAKTLTSWFLATVSLFLFNGLVESVFHVSINYVTILVLSLVMVLVLTRNDLRKRYEQMWRLDWLLWELRWFESEFRGANFEA
jgi:hypothetical protein